MIPGGNASFSDTVVNACVRNVVGYDYTTQAECTRFGGVGYLIQYNFTAFHISPTLQAIATQALARWGLANSNITVEATIAALPLTRVEASISKSDNAFTAWFLMVLSFPFIAGSFATFVVLERESKAKHLQTVAGVEPLAYWVSTYLWDVLNYALPLTLTVIFMFAFDVTVLTSNERDVFTGVLALLILFGPAVSGFTYCISFGFTNASLCNVVVIISGFLVGMGGPMTCFILEAVGNDTSNPSRHLVNTANIISWILRFHPCFCLGRGIFYALNIDTINIWYTGIATAWDKHVLLYEVVFLAWESIVYITLAVLMDSWSLSSNVAARWNWFRGLLTRPFELSKTKDENIAVAVLEDSDVVEEQTRVLNGGVSDNLIVVNGLTKVYNSGKKAVDSLSFGVARGTSRFTFLVCFVLSCGFCIFLNPPLSLHPNPNVGECFGLVGINGAGKTTTMQMLTAEFPPSSGDAMLAGYSVSREPQKTRRRVGYCPQFDAHFSNLSGREHVELYALVKGVPKDFLKQAVAAKLAEVGLNDYDSDRLTSEYSGGMRRRLSLACATIGQPQIIFLDECSTGVDPVARREIWRLILKLVSAEIPREDRTSVILTTHSMEECEALCRRIGIMANGRLRCLGSAQHLKSKFGTGYQIEMKCKGLERDDGDYSDYKATLANFKANEDQVREGAHPEVFFTLEEANGALNYLVPDGSLSMLVAPEHPIGQTIFRSCTSQVGATLDELTAFATNELRIKALEGFIESNFSAFVLRERQANKVRYEVGSEGIKISRVFALIESNKSDLKLDDYGISQTTLEQVFNHHAKEAEALKHVIAAR
jgi:ATP-binding cassette, subfamily A (ABC1), member 3